MSSIAATNRSAVTRPDAGDGHQARTGLVRLGPAVQSPSSAFSDLVVRTSTHRSTASLRSSGDRSLHRRPRPAPRKSPAGPSKRAAILALASIRILVLIIFVRAPTSASRMPQIVFRSRDSVFGMCTDGRSTRQETSLRARASRWSVFVPAGTHTERLHQCRRHDPRLVSQLLRGLRDAECLRTGLDDDSALRPSRQVKLAVRLSPSVSPRQSARPRRARRFVISSRPDRSQHGPWLAPFACGI